MSGRDSVALMFQINLPLWRDSYSAGQRQAQAMAMSIEQEKIDTENSLLAKAAQSYYDYNDSIRRIRLYGHADTKGEGTFAGIGDGIQGRDSRFFEFDRFAAAAAGLLLVIPASAGG